MMNKEQLLKQTATALKNIATAIQDVAKDLKETANDVSALNGQKMTATMEVELYDNTAQIKDLADAASNLYSGIVRLVVNDTEDK